MAGTKAGGLKAAATTKKKYGKGFYAEIGRKGGQNGHTGGFAANPELAKEAGRKGSRKYAQWLGTTGGEKMSLYYSKTEIERELKREENIERIANALERIADSLEEKEG